MWIAELLMRALAAFTDPDANGGGNRGAGGIADMPYRATYWTRPGG
jgi:hypothetical protein